MITLFALWEKFCGEVNTHQGGFVRPNRQFPNWVNDISIELFNEHYLAWQKTQKISDELTTFLRSLPVKVLPGTSTYDIIPYPQGYEFFSSCRYYHKGDYQAVDCETLVDKTNYNASGLQECTIQLIDNSRWGSVANHRIKKVRPENPYITQFDKGFKLIPNNKGIKYVVLDWFQSPKQGTFNYTLGPGDQIIYDPNSQALEWKPTMINEFVTRLSIKYGKFVRDSFIYQSSAAEKEIKA